MNRASFIAERILLAMRVFFFLQKVSQEDWKLEFLGTRNVYIAVNYRQQLNDAQKFRCLILLIIFLQNFLRNKKIPGFLLFSFGEGCTVFGATQKKTGTGKPPGSKLSQSQIFLPSQCTLSTQSIHQIQSESLLRNRISSRHSQPTQMQHSYCHEKANKCTAARLIYGSLYW